VTADETHQAIEASFRIERARLIAGLARMTRNIDLAEELAQDALVAALSEWPKAGDLKGRTGRPLDSFSLQSKRSCESRF
jgi:DNA-directed RNA polymerase specialized sigma24 family protein